MSIFSKGIVLIITVFLLACGSVEEVGEDINTIGESCKVGIETLKTQNTISPVCKDAINSLLPSPIHNLDDTLLALGRSTSGDKTLLFVLSSQQEANITLKILEETEERILNASEYSIKFLRDFDTPETLLSLSSVVDYSASMSDEDIDDAVSIYSDIFSVFSVTSLLESEIRLFSDNILQKLDFTTSKSSLNNNIMRDMDIERGGTALYDAMGTAFNALAMQEGVIKLMIVATDGLENASSSYSKAQLFALSKEHHIPVIILGSLFSDVEEMQEIAKETNGFFIYNKTFLKVKEDVSVFVEMLKNIQVIEINQNNLTDASITLDIDGKSVTF